MRIKLEAVLECWLNGEQKEASKLLHEYIVDRSRSIYGEMSEEDKEPSEFDSEELELGGDESESFIDDVEVDGDVDVDMGEFGDDGEMEGDEEGDIESRMAELETNLEELMAQFDELMSGEDASVDAEDDGEDSDFEGFDDSEEMKEATNFSNKVSVDMSKEGQESGNGKTQPVDTTSTFAKKPAAASSQEGKPIKIDTSEEKGAGQVSYNKEKVAHSNTKSSPVGVPSNTEKSGGSKSIIGESRVAKKTK